jgi:hypothetical protein
MYCVDTGLAMGVSPLGIPHTRMSLLKIRKREFLTNSFRKSETHLSFRVNYQLLFSDVDQDFYMQTHFNKAP